MISSLDWWYFMTCKITRNDGMWFLLMVIFKKQVFSDIAPWDIEGPETKNCHEVSQIFHNGTCNQDWENLCGRMEVALGMSVFITWEPFISLYQMVLYVIYICFIEYVLRHINNKNETLKTKLLIAMVYPVVAWLVWILVRGCSQLLIGFYVGAWAR